MRFGVSTERHGRADGRDRVRATQVVLEAQAAEQAGFDSFGLAARVGAEDVVTSWIAATTRRVRIRPVVGAVADSARRWATIDTLSGGRLDLSLTTPEAVSALCGSWARSAEPLLPVQSPHPPVALVGDHLAAGRHRLALVGVLADHDGGAIDEVVDGYRQAWDAGIPLPGVTPSGDITLSVQVPAAGSALRDLVAHLATLGVAEVVIRLDGDHEELTGRIRALGAHLPALRAEAERVRPSDPAGRPGLPFPHHDRSLR